MKIIILIFLLAVLIPFPVFSKNYFVSTSGNDSASGLTIEESWKSLEKVNSFIFQPGDNILFEKNGVWYGQLFPKGSGEEGNPIRISSYGNGKKPVINMGEAEGAAIRLTNQSWWIIEDIEITSGALPKIGIGRQGIVMIVKGDQPQDIHLIVRDCYIHDIWGQLGGSGKYNGYNSAAILVRAELRKSRLHPNRTTFDHVLIENNRIERFDKCGIIIRGGKNHIVVRGNYLENIGGDAIFLNGTYKGLIEHNIVKGSCLRSGNTDIPGGDRFWPHTVAIWIQGADKTIIQYNEVYNTGRATRNSDGQAFDFDYYTTNSILQYNYSKNNKGGFMLLMGNTFGNQIRYNISENDQFQIMKINSNMELEENYIYNNIFYKDDGLGTFSILGENQKLINASGAYFRNNVFYAAGQGQFQLAYSTGKAPNINFIEDAKPTKDSKDPMFLNNAYYGWHTRLPEDRGKITSDLLFIAPGTGKKGYRTNKESPLVNTGVFLPFVIRNDFYGNEVEDGKPDIGVYEQVGSKIAEDKDKLYMLETKKLAILQLKETKWAITNAIASKESGKLTLIPIIPINKIIRGTLRLKDKESGKLLDRIRLNNLKDRKILSFKIRMNDETIQNTLLIGSIKNGNDSLDWEIPISRYKF